jgi:hypothetical protein
VPGLVLRHFVPRSLEESGCAGQYYEFETKLIAEDAWLFAVELPLVSGKLYSSETGPHPPLGAGAIRVSVRFDSYQGNTLALRGGKLKDGPSESAHILRAE